MPPALRSPRQEIMLLDLVERLERFREGRVAAHLHLSGLAPAYRRDHVLRIATETLSRSLQPFEGQMFALANSDLFFIAKDAPMERLDAVINRMRALLAEDPLVAVREREQQEAFCTWYVLEKDYDALRTAARRLREAAESSPEPTPAAPPLAPVKPEQLAKLEQALSRADVSSVVRRQTACTLVGDEAPQPLFEEIFVAIEELQNTVTPGIDLLSNRWLFQYLTQTLDQRVLRMLRRDGMNAARPFSLNLNVATVLSPEFAQFEADIAPQLRGRLVIEMNKLDVFADMGAFLFARDYLRDRGFRLCLDGLTHYTLPYYDRARLGFDLVKIYWTPDSIDHVRPDMIPELRRTVMEAGQARTILCRCESARAVTLGQELGIVMFQGRHIDRLFNDARAGMMRG